MFRGEHPKGHQELFSAYIVERINWFDTMYEPGDYVFRELKIWAEDYAQKHNLSVPEIDWEQYAEEEEA